MTDAIQRAISEAEELLYPFAGVPDTELRLERARTLLNYASVLQQREGLAGARAGEARAQEQLELQRKMAGRVPEAVDLIEEIARTDSTKWSSETVTNWISKARELVQS